MKKVKARRKAWGDVGGIASRPRERDEAQVREVKTENVVRAVSACVRDHGYY
jgi:hypothetical protein